MEDSAFPTASNAMKALVEDLRACADIPSIKIVVERQCARTGTISDIVDGIFGGMDLAEFGARSVIRCQSTVDDSSWRFRSRSMFTIDRCLHGCGICSSSYCSQKKWTRRKPSAALQVLWLEHISAHVRSISLSGRLTVSLPQLQ